ncbi:helix-turn-helix transcriptional regulator [Burkholderia metallica]|uniref:helix-turn-helix domain-containing protein n=1 Tax=Burkholderia metallica TaxID=488729 RepID=UPI00157A2F90|nr:helix-turn-helix transcriptional regulator [Burkholderia metallica]NTZ82377.1 helix-turn-helix transcriptional regulator [Burkholderia metallica]
MDIGQRLKEERERLRLNQTAFGDIGGMGKTTVQAWERGTAYPNAAFLQAAAKFGVDVAYVITGVRGENVASNPIELSYLRICRRLADTEGGQQAGNAALLGVLASYGLKLFPDEPESET